MAKGLVPQEVDNNEAFDPRFMLGRLIERVDTIATRLESHIVNSHDEHNKVHDIVDATSEAVRNVARDVQEIKPIVKDYELKAGYINDAINLAKAYGAERDQRIGATKLIRVLKTIIIALGGLIAAIVYNASVNWLHSIDKIPH